jgi:hypothetical protein
MADPSRRRIITLGWQSWAVLVALLVLLIVAAVLMMG